MLRTLVEFETLGIALISLKDNLDLTTPAGRLMFQIIGAMAELERSIIQERVRAGLRNAKTKGRRLGRPAVETDAAVLARLRNQGLSMAAIARQLGISVATVHGRLRA